MPTLHLRARKQESPSLNSGDLEILSQYSMESQREILRVAPTQGEHARLGHDKPFYLSTESHA
jgi:hypothetical protein